MTPTNQYQPEPTRFHPAVVAIAIFMSGLFAIVLVLVFATRGGGEPSAAGAAATATATMPGMDMTGTPPRRTRRPPRPRCSRRTRRRPRRPVADEHKPYPAELPPLVDGVLQVKLALEDVELEIAPGVTFTGWTFAGGAPGSRDPRQAGAEGARRADQRRRDPALDRLPRGAHRPEPGVQGTSSPARASPSTSPPTTPASSCTTAAPRRCSRTSRAACTARSSSTRSAAGSRRPTAPTCWSAASGT